jgi:hypothetical protein
MKIPRYTCAFLPGCNDPRSVAASNRHPSRELPEGQACPCYRPVDPCSGQRVDCSSLVDEVANQALHDEAQKLFGSSRARKAAGLSVGTAAVKEFREECARGWLASMLFRPGGAVLQFSCSAIFLVLQFSCSAISSRGVGREGLRGGGRLGRGAGPKDLAGTPVFCNF